MIIHSIAISNFVNSVTNTGTCIKHLSCFELFASVIVLKRKCLLAPAYGMFTLANELEIRNVLVQMLLKNRIANDTTQAFNIESL